MKNLFQNVNDLLKGIKEKPVIRDIITTSFWSTIGKGAGFIVPFFIATWFGVSSETDAFFFAYGLILFFSGFFAPVIESIIVPFIAEKKDRGEDIGKFIGKILGVSGVWLTVLGGLSLFPIKFILGLTTQFNQHEIDLVFKLLIETIPLIILLVWTSTLTGALNAFKVFTFPAIAPALRAVINICFIFLFKDALGIHSIAFGYVVGEIFRFVLLSSAIRKLNLFLIQFSFNTDKVFGDFFKTASYQIIGMIAVGLSPVVDRTMASWLGKGSISLLEYANRLYTAPVIFFQSGLLVVLLSHWSSEYNKSGLQSLTGKIQNLLKPIAIITLSITFLLLLFSTPLVKAAFARGSFGKNNIAQVSEIFSFYCLGFFPYILSQIYVRGHIVLKNTKVLMKCSIYKTFLNVVLNFILMQFLGAAGIALATTFLSIYTLFFLRHHFLRSVANVNT